MGSPLILIRRYVLRDEAKNETIVSEDEVATIHPAAGEDAVPKLLDWLRGS
jgi:hypothetical protein